MNPRVRGRPGLALKIALATSAIALLAVIATAWTGTHFLEAASHAQSGVELERRSVNAMLLVDARISAAFQHLEALAWNADVQQSLRMRPAAASARPALTRLASAELWEIQAVDLRGKTRAASAPRATRSGRDDSWWRAALADGWYVGDTLQRDPASGRWLLPLAVAVRDARTDRTVGALCAWYNWEVLRDRLLQAEASSPSAFVLLVDGAGLVLAGPDALPPGTAVARVPGLEPLAAGARKQATGWLPFGPAALHGPGIMGFAHSRGYLTYPGKPRWFVAVGDADAVLLADARRGRRQVLASAALVALVVLLGTTLVVRRFLDPLSRVATAIQAVGRGAMDARAEVKSGDELQFLADSFNGMTDRLQDLYATLETRVDERTRALREEIARRLRVEQDLIRARDAAEAASRAKSEFLANISHELRTPLNGIIGMTDLTLDTRLAPHQREFLETVRISADALLVLVNDLLDFSKIEAGRMDLETAVFSVRDLVGDSLKPLGARAEQKGIELAYAVDSDVPDALLGDPVRLRQIIVNLVGNAVKFTERGEVLLCVRSATADDGHITLDVEVSDTGIGIPADKQRMIFEAFSQVDASASRHYEGTGLGLAISSRLVTLMGGRIGVDSTVGRGSRFHFTARFGVADEETVASAHLEPPSSDTVSRLRDLPVLVVDDHATNRRILMEMVRGWGMRPAAAEGGEEALQALQDAARDGLSFALVLLDLMMPGMDGFTVAAAIVRQPQLGEPSVVMLSSSGRVPEVARLRALRIGEYLVKPVKPSELLEAILRCRGLLEQAAPADAPGLPAHRRLRILLAEDNEVNQRVATGHLLRWGHAVTVAGNGLEAVAAAAATEFDLILMDVQMPEMGGFEATARIRSAEKEGRARTPIVAITAHAMTGDRERCLQAGMDGYVSKPLRARQLFEAMAAVIPDLGVPSLPAIETPPPATDEVDADTLRFEFAQDEDLLRRIFTLYHAQRAPQMVDLREAAAAGDGPRLQRAAHRFGGTLSALHARAALTLARALEAMGRGGSLEGAEALCDDLDRALDRLEARLEPLIREDGLKDYPSPGLTAPPAAASPGAPPCGPRAPGGRRPTPRS